MNTHDYFGFRGKTVVVTGAGSGMGEAAAKMLVDLGAEVHAVGNRKKIAVPAFKTYYYDLGVKENIDELIEQLPAKLDAVFICQGIAHDRGKNDVLVFKVNYLSDRHLAEGLAPRVVDNGSITFISSNGGFGWQQKFDLIKKVLDTADYDEAVAWYEAHPEAHAHAYTFAKQCLNAYVAYKVFDPLYIERRVRLNNICPGNTITGLTDEFNRTSSSTGNPEEGQKIIEYIFQSRWKGRWATAEEMGYPMVAIGSQIFSYMSGQNIFFDYGLCSAWEIDELQGITQHY
jgi:NAD(P)-dependent dehydrogenase (short-subunit alcohol dehydrogenase family)